jgi:hypothetical protein
MSVPYSLAAEPDRPNTIVSEPTEQLKQGTDPTDASTPLLADADSSEGAPETFMPMAATSTGPAAMTNPDPQVGHDGKLPARICPGGYGCNDES